MVSRLAVPPVPLALGLGGLIPFAGLSALTALGGSHALGVSAAEALSALLGYAAIIASFLGGIRWGVALRDGGPHWKDYVLSVAPSLAAWACLALDPTRAALALAVLIAGWGFVDQDLAQRRLAPPWFGGLRAVLSAGAALALAVAGLA